MCHADLSVLASSCQPLAVRRDGHGENAIAVATIASEKAGIGWKFALFLLGCRLFGVSLLVGLALCAGFWWFWFSRGFAASCLLL